MILLIETEVVLDGESNVLGQGRLAHAREADRHEKELLHVAHFRLRDQVY